MKYSTVKIKLLDLQDVDCAELPQVRLTNLDTGDVRHSSGSFRGTDKSSYTFTDSLLIFETDQGKIEISIGIFFIDHISNQLVQYDGIGKFQVDCQSRYSFENIFTCTLYQDGDQSLELGFLSYSFDITSTIQNKESLSETEPANFGTFDNLNEVRGLVGCTPSDDSGLGNKSTSDKEDIKEVVVHDTEELVILSTCNTASPNSILRREKDNSFTSQANIPDIEGNELDDRLCIITTSEKETKRRGTASKVASGINENNNKMSKKESCCACEPAATVTHINMKRPTLVKSVNGKLIGCLEGCFFVNSRQKNDGPPVYLSKNYSVFIDVSMNPCSNNSEVEESVAGFVPNSLDSMVSEQNIVLSSDVNSWVTLKKYFQMDIVWAVQQRQIPQLLISVYAEKRSASSNISSPSVANGFNMTKSSHICIGSQVLDTTAIINYRNGSTTRCFIPILTTTPSKGSYKLKVIGNSMICGWILVGLQFYANVAPSMPSAIIQQQQNLVREMDAIWSALTPFPSLYCLGLAGNDKSSNTALAEKALQSHPLKIVACSLHIALSCLEFASPRSILDVRQATVAAEEAKRDEVVITCIIKITNDITSNSFAYGKLMGRSSQHEENIQSNINNISNTSDNIIVWSAETNDLVFNINKEHSLPPCLYFYLVKGKVNCESNIFPEGGGVVAPEWVILGESNLPLCHEQFDKGLPVNHSLQFRNAAGERYASMNISIQATAVGGNADVEACDDVIDGGKNNHQSLGAVPLTIEFCEGNIAIASENSIDISSSVSRPVLEPFFECSLQQQQQPLSCGINNTPELNNIARTGFVKILPEQIQQQWTLSCSLYLPHEFSVYLRNIGNNISSCGGMNKNEKGVVLKATTASSASAAVSGNYTLGIVCRNASRLGCPQIGWARVALPRQQLVTAVRNAKPLELWVTLQQQHQSNSGSGFGSSIARHSRVKIRISVAPFTDYDAANFPFGVGAVLLRMLGTVTNTAGVENRDELAVAKMSSYTTADTNCLGETNNDPTIPANAIIHSSNNSNDNVDSNDRTLFSQVSARPAHYANEMAIFNENHFVGALPISGASSEIDVKLKTFSGNEAYKTTFPVMSAVAALSTVEDDSLQAQSTAELQIPILNLALARDKIPTGATDFSKYHGSNRLTPKLQMQAVYVPYITGKLILHCRQINFTHTPTINTIASTVSRGSVFESNSVNTATAASKSSISGVIKRASKVSSSNSIAKKTVTGKKLPVPPNTTAAGMDNCGAAARDNGKRTSKPMALRYLVGNDTANFAFSSPFEVVLPTPSSLSREINSNNTGSIKPSPAYAIPTFNSAASGRDANNTNSVDNVTFVNLNTFDIIADSIRKTAENERKVIQSTSEDTAITSTSPPCTMMPLFLSLIMLPEYPADTSDLFTSGATSCVGIGAVPTAPLYYQALRAAASSSMYQTSSPADDGYSNNNNNNTQSNSTSSKNAFSSAQSPGKSAWARLNVDLFDPVTKIQIGTAIINVQFIMTSIPGHVTRLLKNCLNADHCSSSKEKPSTKARIELGLKQAFLLADVDKSGSVSSMELLEVIRNAGKSKVKQRQRTGGQIKSAQTTNSVGMEDAIQLLLHLANHKSLNTAPTSPTTNKVTAVLEGEDNDDDGARHDDDTIVNRTTVIVPTVSDAELTELVRDIFSRLDVDGDGFVSWWEWQSVLKASMMGHNPDPAFKCIHPFDTLVIGLQAAFDAVVSILPCNRNGNDCSNDNCMLPYIQLRSTNGDRQSGDSDAYAVVANMGRNYDYDEDILNRKDKKENEAAVLVGPQSRTVTRLHSMVKSLRLTNNVLAKRFERALETARTLAIDLDANTDTTGNNGSNNRNMFLPLENATICNVEAGRQRWTEIDHLEYRIQQTELQAGSNLSSLLQAKERSDQLEAQMLELNRVNDNLVRVRDQSIANSKQCNAHLQNEIAAHSARLSEAQAARRKLHNATLNIILFLTKYVLPKMKLMRKQRDASKLAQVLRNQLVRSNYKENKVRKLKAVVRIQCVFRGKLSRLQMRNKNAAALKIQCSYRKHQSCLKIEELRAHKAQREAKEKARMLRRQQDEAAASLAAAIRRAGKKKRIAKEKCVQKIQKCVRLMHLAKVARIAVEAKRKERDAEIAEAARLQAEALRLQAEADEAKEQERLRQEAIQRAEELAAQDAAKQREMELKRSLEEIQKQNSAAAIQRAANQRKALKEGKQLRDFLALQNALYPRSKPSLQDLALSVTTNPTSTVGVLSLSSEPCYWIAFPQQRRQQQSQKEPPLSLTNDTDVTSTTTNHGNNEDVDTEIENSVNNNSRHFGLGNKGKIQAVDKKHRLMEVLYLYRQDAALAVNSTASFVTEKIPYDHPLILWYHNQPEPVVVAVVEQQPEVVVEPQLIIETALPAEELDFSDDEDAGPEEDAPEDDRKGLGGYRPPITRCRGFLVTSSEDGQEVSGIVGRVVGVDIDKALIAVYFEDEKKDATAGRTTTKSEVLSSSKWIPYASTYLTWHKKDSKLIIAYKQKRAAAATLAASTKKAQVEMMQENLSQQQTMATAVVPPKISPRLLLSQQLHGTISGTGRPNTLTESLNYYVGVHAIADGNDGAVHKEEEADAGLYTGKVVAVDHNKRTVTILFDSEVRDDEEDKEEFHWKSPSIVWMHPPTVSRPVNIHDAVGYRVEVMTAQPQHQQQQLISGSTVHDDDDMLMSPGKIVSVNAAARTVHVVFDAASDDGASHGSGGISSGNSIGSNAGHDTEDIDFDSAHIMWLSSSINNTIPPITPSSTITHNNQPSSLSEIPLGCRVEVTSREPDAEPGDMFPGSVVATDAATDTIRIRYDSAALEGEEEDEIAEDVEDLPWHSPDISWIGLPATAAPISTSDTKTMAAPISTTDTASLHPHNIISNLTPTIISDAVGRTVKLTGFIGRRDETDSEHNSFDGIVRNIGKVVAIDETNQSMQIDISSTANNNTGIILQTKQGDHVLAVLLMNNNHKGDKVTEPASTTYSCSYASSDRLVWIDGGTTSSEATTAVDIAAVVNQQCVGSVVEVLSSEPDAAALGDMYLAKVLSVDIAAKTVTVLFDKQEEETEKNTDVITAFSVDEVETSSQDGKKSIIVNSKEEEEEEVEDVEVFPWSSPLLHWVGIDPLTAVNAAASTVAKYDDNNKQDPRFFKVISRPATIQETIGKYVGEDNNKNNGRTDNFVTPTITGIVLYSGSVNEINETNQSVVVTLNNTDSTHNIEAKSIVLPWNAINDLVDWG